MSTENAMMSEELRSSTPSLEKSETPNWVRIVGMFGMVALGASIYMYLTNAYKYITKLKGPTVIRGLSVEEELSFYPTLLVFVLFVGGIILMLLQASKERDKVQRRGLGLFGVCVFCLGVLLGTHVMFAEVWRHWLGAGADTAPETLLGQSKWAGLFATIVMAFVLLTAWIAPFVRAAADSKVSLLGMAGSWVNYLGKPLVAANTLYGLAGLAVLTFLAWLLRDYLNTYCDMILQYSKENIVPYGIGSYILLFLVVGLPFMLVLANKEADEAWAKMPTSILGVVGIVAAFFGLMGFCTDLFKVPDYTLPYGFALSLLGLLFIMLYITQRDSETDNAQGLARLTAYAGFVVVVVATIRSLLPAIVEIGWMQDTFPSLESLNLTSYLVPNGFIFLVVGSLYWFVGRIFSSTSKLMILTRRELGSFFTSPIGYIVLGATLVVAWLVFNNWIAELVESRGAYAEPVVSMYFFSMFIIIFMMIAIPMLTMRLVSEENRAGTIEILMTSPVDEFSIVMSKFLAGWLYTVLIYVTWAIYPMLLRIAGQETFDYRPMMSSILGLCVVSMGFVAMGVFFSSITKNQIVALLLTFAGMLLMFMLYFIEYMMSSGSKADPNSPVFDFIRYISFVHHVLYSFAQGKVELKHILFHLSFAAFWLFLTVRVLESRKWR